jgi:hypothetical protein
MNFVFTKKLPEGVLLPGAATAANDRKQDVTHEDHDKSCDDRLVKVQIRKAGDIGKLSRVCYGTVAWPVIR